MVYAHKTALVVLFKGERKQDGSKSLGKHGIYTGDKKTEILILLGQSFTSNSEISKHCNMSKPKFSRKGLIFLYWFKSDKIALTPGSFWVEDWTQPMHFIPLSVSFAKLSENWNLCSSHVLNGAVFSTLFSSLGSDNISESDSWFVLSSVCAHKKQTDIIQGCERDALLLLNLCQFRIHRECMT